MVRKELTRREQRVEDLLLTVRRTADMPFSSAADHLGFGNFTLPKIHSLLDEAMGRGLLGVVQAGQTFSVQARHIVYRRGVDTLVLQRRFTWCIHFLRLVCIWRDIAPAIQPQVAGDHTGSISRPFPQSVVVVLVERYGMRPRRQMAATSLPYHADRLRCYEAVHRLAPRLFRCGAVRTPAVLPLDQGDNSRRLVLDEVTELVGLTWRSDVSEGPASALGLYRDKNGRITWVPFVWRGLHAGDTEDAKSLHVFLSGYDRRPGFRYGLAPASPIGVVFVVIDRLAGLRVRLQFPHLPMAIVTADGELVHQLDPVPPVGTVVDAGEYTSSVGYPE